MGESLVGKVLLRRYRVDTFVATGGMGAVYKVWDVQRNVPLAMKVLSSDLVDDPAGFRSFQREAEALKALSHPNIVTFYGLEQADDFLFLIEDFIEGPTLKEILTKRKVLPLTEALAILQALCAALGYAHSKQMIYCDVKPGNVMIDRGGRVCLTDFGIVRQMDLTVTSTFSGAGTPGYMAPEQVQGLMVHAQTDIYALGILLFEMLTGQRPFRGTEPEVAKHRRLAHRARPLGPGRNCPRRTRARSNPTFPPRSPRSFSWRWRKTRRSASAVPASFTARPWRPPGASLGR